MRPRWSVVPRALARQCCQRGHVHVQRHLRLHSMVDYNDYILWLYTNNCNNVTSVALLLDKHSTKITTLRQLTASVGVGLSIPMPAFQVSSSTRGSNLRRTCSYDTRCKFFIYSTEDEFSVMLWLRPNSNLRILGLGVKMVGKFGNSCIPLNIPSLSHDHHRHVSGVAGDLCRGEVDLSHHRPFENAANSDVMGKEAVRGARSGSR